MHVQTEYSNGNGRPRGKGPGYNLEYVIAVKAGDWRRINMCLSKNSYQTEHEAETEIVRSTKKRGRQLSPYSCPYCHEYHITHQPARNPLKAA